MKYLTSGESHGKCLNAIIEGLPSGFEIKEEFINDIITNYDIDGIECMHSEFSEEQIQYLLELCNSRNYLCGKI